MSDHEWLNWPEDDPDLGDAETADLAGLDSGGLDSGGLSDFGTGSPDDAGFGDAGPDALGYGDDGYGIGAGVPDEPGVGDDTAATGPGFEPLGLADDETGDETGTVAGAGFGAADPVGDPSMGTDALAAGYPGADSLVGADPDAVALDGWDDDPFPELLPLHAAVEPVDGYPWVDADLLGVAGPAAPADLAAGYGGVPSAAELFAYAAEDMPPAGDGWAALLASEDPAASALARFWSSAG